MAPQTATRHACPRNPTHTRPHTRPHWRPPTREPSPVLPAAPAAPVHAQAPEALEEGGGWAAWYLERVPTAGLVYHLQEAEEPGTVRLADLRRLARTCPAGLLEALALDVFTGHLPDAVSDMATAMALGHPDAARILAHHAGQAAAAVRDSL
jgi:hypothetical protein